MVNDLLLMPADIVVEFGTGRIAKAIRWCKRKEGSRASHVGLITREGWAWTPGAPAIICEALWDQGVIERTFRSAYPADASRIAIYRPLNLTPVDRTQIAKWARDKIGSRYSFVSILLHLFGWETLVTGRRWICSRFVGEAFQQQGFSFGIGGQAADPGDIESFCRLHPDKYQKLF